MNTRMDRQDIIDMTLDMKLALDRKMILVTPALAKCDACPDLYPTAYQTFTDKYCIPCHLEKTYGIILEESIENVPALLTGIPEGMHKVVRQARGHGFY